MVTLTFDAPAVIILVALLIPCGIAVLGFVWTAVKALNPKPYGEITEEIQLEALEYDDTDEIMYVEDIELSADGDYDDV